MSRRWCFPFAAVVGQADVKEALLIALVNPKTGGVLVAEKKVRPNQCWCERLRSWLQRSGLSNCR